jgi:phytoene dehydrogenase-like protein
MDVENPVRKGPEQILTRGATEVKEQNKFDMLVLQGIDDVVLAGRLENARHFPRVNVFGLHPMRPADLQNATGAPGGSIYGTSSNGSRAAFQRPANKSTIPGLYLVGGSSHPGGGLPLVGMSAEIVADLIGRA